MRGAADCCQVPSKCQLESLRQQEAIEKDRARIARDIHDQLGASLTQVALLGELVESDKNAPHEVEAVRLGEVDIGFVDQ